MKIKSDNTPTVTNNEDVWKEEMNALYEVKLGINTLRRLGYEVTCIIKKTFLLINSKVDDNT
jgi:hypothetical protein